MVAETVIDARNWIGVSLGAQLFWELGDLSYDTDDDDASSSNES